MRLWWVEKGRWIHQPNPSHISWVSLELWGQGYMKALGTQSERDGDWGIWVSLRGITHMGETGRGLGWNSQTNFILWLQPWCQKDLIFPTEKELISFYENTWDTIGLHSRLYCGCSNLCKNFLHFRELSHTPSTFWFISMRSQPISWDCVK